MKLRDSIISIQHISNELNIPISSGTTKADIFPSDYETSRAEKLAAEQSVITENNIKLIDKCTKATGARARNLKKSMLNDNKLIRLRDKLLRRSKSTVGLSTKCPDYKPNHCDIDNTKEEHQNKENEQPKLRSNYENVESITTTSPPKIMSPNRNRVKMGTRVFSSQFLNKSLDNIYDNAMSVYDSEADFDNKVIIQCKSNAHQNQTQMRRGDGECLDGCTTDSSSTRKCSSDDRCLSSTTDMERMSLKSSSLSSIQCSEKMCEVTGDSSPTTEAYVIRK